MSRIEFLVALEMELRDRGIRPEREEIRDFVKQSWLEAQDNPDANAWADVYQLPRRLLHVECQRSAG